MDDLDLARRLRRRLLPWTLTVLVVIGFLPPAIYYFRGRGALEVYAGVLAESLADRLQALAVDGGTLWKYQAPKYGQIIQEFASVKETLRFRVLDAAGQPVELYEYRTGVATGLMAHREVVGAAALLFNDRRGGTIEVYISQRALLNETLGGLILSLVVGITLGFLLLNLPVAFVRTMEERIRALVLSVQRANEELERTAAEQERLLRRLAAKNKDLDDFVYAVSHDLKSPLVVIQGMATMLRADQAERLDERGQRYLERIGANVEQMERLIGDLLALSRVGREGRPAERVAVNEVVDEVLATLHDTIQARGVKVTCGDLGVVSAVRTQLHQVFSNLLSNAVKYLGDAPAPQVEIGCARRDGVVEYWVRDNGVGIDPAYHGKIFEVFQRLKDVEAAGSGVGLAIVKKSVEGAGGRIWVESARGQGATFRFTWLAEATA